MHFWKLQIQSRLDDISWFLAMCTWTRLSFFITMGKIGCLQNVFRLQFCCLRLAIYYCFIRSSTASLIFLLLSKNWKSKFKLLVNKIWNQPWIAFLEVMPNYLFVNVPLNRIEFFFKGPKKYTKRRVDGTLVIYVFWLLGVGVRFRWL